MGSVVWTGKMGVKRCVAVCVCVWREVVKGGWRRVAKTYEVGSV